MEGESEVDTTEELVAAHDLYETITFREPNAFYNRIAPEPYIAFAIGSALSLVTIIYWYYKRFRPHYSIEKKNALIQNHPEIQAPTRHHSFFFYMISITATLSDNDDPNFTMLRLIAQSMLFLGGFQLNYEFTFVFMLLYYSIISLSDTLRVLISISDSESLQDLTKISKRDRSTLKSTVNLALLQQQQSGNNSNSKSGVQYVELKGGNVYEDLTKPYTVVGLVFITQAILISLIGIDIHNSSTQTTIDRTPNVPVVGTLGSYLVYILGILMQCVYILGPKQNFGTSEQNPHYWIKLFLAIKQTGATISYFDPSEDQQKEMILSHNDIRIWIPFIMSFLINGVGFHILVHALPIQVAAQSTLAGIVIRAVGMMYLVDLDDAAGTVMKVFENTTSSNNTNSTSKAKDRKSPPALSTAPVATTTSNDDSPDNSPMKMINNNNDVVDIEEKGVIPIEEHVEELPKTQFAVESPQPFLVVRKDDHNDDVDDNNHNMLHNMANTSSTTTNANNNNNLLDVQKTANELIERARRDAEQIQQQLQHDLNALAQRMTTTVAAVDTTTTITENNDDNNHHHHDTNHKKHVAFAPVVVVAGSEMELQQQSNHNTATTTTAETE